MVETNKKVGQVFFFSGPVATWARGAATREQCLRGREAQGPGIKKRRTIRGSALVFRGSPFNPEKPRHLRCLQIPRWPTGYQGCGWACCRCCCRRPRASPGPSPGGPSDGVPVPSTTRARMRVMLQLCQHHERANDVFIITFVCAFVVLEL